MARTLIDRGWTEAHPLLGGLDAWRQAGYPVEPKSAPSRIPSSV